MKTNRRKFLTGLAGFSIAVPSTKSLARSTKSEKLKAEFKWRSEESRLNTEVYKFGFFHEGKLVEELWHELDRVYDILEDKMCLGVNIAPSWPNQTFSFDTIKIYLEGLDLWVPLDFNDGLTHVSNGTLTLQPDITTGLVAIG